MSLGVLKGGGGRGRTQGHVDAALVDDAGGGGRLDGVHVLADAGKVGRGARGGADGGDDARERALGEDGDVLGRDGRGQGEDGGGVLHFGSVFKTNECLVRCCSLHVTSVCDGEGKGGSRLDVDEAGGIYTAFLQLLS